MTAAVTPAQLDTFYRVALIGLGLLEARAGAPRRFGPNADARWNAFRGGLQDWDRLDLLVRDAAVRHPAGFAPRVVFDLPALADDEPCGPDWPGPTATEAAALLRSGAAHRVEMAGVLAAAADAWRLTVRPLPAEALAGLQPSSRLLVAGSGAVIALASAFAPRPELDLGDQAVLVADDPGTRQLFGLALAGLGSTRPARIVGLDVTPDAVRARGFTAADRVLVSDDVAPADRDRVLVLGRALGAAG